MNPQFIKSAVRPADYPADAGVEIAVVGRSNSGKSSALNRLAGVKKLARVSKTPGRTQLINFFELKPQQRLVDLPGYGFARVPQATRIEWRSMVGAYFEQRASLRGLIVTIDVRRGFKDPDLQVFDWAGELGIPVLGLLSKADKLSRASGMRQRQLLQREAPAHVALVLFSALSGVGLDEARATLLQWLEVGASNE
jgi:GTP-binding protein